VAAATVAAATERCRAGMAVLEVEVTAAAAVAGEATAETAETAEKAEAVMEEEARVVVATGAGPGTWGAAPSFQRKQSCGPCRRRTERSM